MSVNTGQNIAKSARHASKDLTIIASGLVTVLESIIIDNSTFFYSLKASITGFN
jgi:hypothetical protein